MDYCGVTQLVALPKCIGEEPINVDNVVRTLTTVGTTYDGEEDSERHGNGTFIYLSGNIYVGEWMGGLRQSWNFNF